MKRITEHIRDRLHARLGLHDDRPRHDPATFDHYVKKRYDELDVCVKLAKQRLFMGAIRYGSHTDGRYDYGSEIIERAERYFASRNREHLIDVLNFCALEFSNPFLEHTYYHPVDDGEHTPEHIKPNEY